jgi:hypothetical protein
MSEITNINLHLRLTNLFLGNSCTPELSGLHLADFDETPEITEVDKFVPEYLRGIAHTLVGIFADNLMDPNK